MKIRPSVILSLLGAALFAAVSMPVRAQTAQALPYREVPDYDKYEPSPDTRRQPGVPQGEVFEFKLDDSRIFPGTTRTIIVYVPAQYMGEKPACVFLQFDRLAWVPIVFDNLIARGEIPLTIAICVTRGDVPSGNQPANPRIDRSFEFDTMDDRLGRFLIEEVLPRVEATRAPWGRTIRLSADPNDRVIAGYSTGAIAAFNTAWHHPEAFRRVFSSIGTYVGMRGGDGYPVLVRKTEPKPLRIFMQDGSHDQWPYGPELGDWWFSNQTMERALIFAGYAVNHAWGTGMHSARHTAAIFPDAIKWLWQDWPKPVEAGQSGNTVLKEILLPGEGWESVGECLGAPAAIASDATGAVFFSNDGAFYRLDEKGVVVRWDVGAGNWRAFAFGAEGRLYLSDSSGDGRIVIRDTTGDVTVLAGGFHALSLIVTSGGNVYAYEADAAAGDGRIWLVRPDGAKQIVDHGLKGFGGLTPTPDDLWLFVGEHHTRWGYSYRIEQDGTLQVKEPYYVFNVPQWANDSGASGVCMDRNGYAYAATRMGIQVFDRNGRVRAILPLPGNREATGVCFGGADFKDLYVTAGDGIYRRRLNAIGLSPAAQPIELPNGGAD